MTASYESLCIMCVRSMQPRLRTIVQGSIDATSAAAAADTDSDHSAPTRRAAAAAAIVDVSRALCGLACSFLALHPDAHFSEAGCKELHYAMANCLSDAQARVVQVEQQRLLLFIVGGGRSSAADTMDWLQPQPLHLMRIVSGVACALHRCCGGCRPKQVAAFVVECVKAIALLLNKNAQQHYDQMQLQVNQSRLKRFFSPLTSPAAYVRLSCLPPPASKDKSSNPTSTPLSSSASWPLFRLSLRLITAGEIAPLPSNYILNYKHN